MHGPRRATPEQAALLEDRRTARRVNRPVDAAAPEQGRIRRVDDRIDLLLRDGAEDELDHAYAGRGKRTGRSSGSGMSPCAKPVARYTPARPPHSPYGASSSAVSFASTQRPRRRDISFTSERSPTTPRS